MVSLYPEATRWSLRCMEGRVDFEVTGRGDGNRKTREKQKFLEKFSKTLNVRKKLSKNKYRDNEWIENNNKETFFKLLDIFNSNQKNIKIKFLFDHSGLAIIKKMRNKINFPEKILSRKFGLKNILRKILR